MLLECFEDTQFQGGLRVEPPLLSSGRRTLEHARNTKLDLREALSQALEGRLELCSQ